jgi:hypothetical protein
MNPKAAVTSATQPAIPSVGQDKSALLRDAAPEMLEKLQKIWIWLDMCAKNREEESEKYRGKFESLVDSCLVDAKNYRATARSVMETIAKADPKWAARKRGAA